MTTASDQLCPGCFKPKGTANPCPHCGFDEAAPRPVQALPLQTLLNNQFAVGRVLGKPGGFGITYLAWDQMLEATVAIKEYLPRELAVRAQDSRTLHPHSSDETELFSYGLEQFLAEARTLAKLDHPNLVRVRQFFKANGTAYLVMDYYQGCSLHEHLDSLPGSRMSEADALALMQPILDGLRAVHAAGFLHRDIKPQNIYLAQTNTGGVRPILLDFGAARQAMGERSRSLSVVISPGYAPFEQYHRKGQQGPATDIYGAAAVLYRMLTGFVPPEATERMAGDDLRPASDFGIRSPISTALTQALAINMDERPASVRAFQQGLDLLVVPLVAQSPAVPNDAQLLTEPSQPQAAPPTDGRRRSRVGVGVQVIASSGRPRQTPQSANLLEVSTAQESIHLHSPGENSRSGAAVRSQGVKQQFEASPGGKLAETDQETKRSGRGTALIGWIGIFSLMLVIGSLLVISAEVDDFDSLVERAEQGDAEDQVTLGNMYELGDGVTQDAHQAAAWYRKAAEQGDADGQFSLGWAYSQGRGVPQDDSQAASWFRKAAEQGKAYAQIGLGVMLEEGRGIPQDDSQAVSWYRKAGEQGSALAQYKLGMMYEEGRGVPQDNGQAINWYRKAAEQGNDAAQVSLRRLE